MWKHIKITNREAGSQAGWLVGRYRKAVSHRIGRFAACTEKLFRFTWKINTLFRLRPTGQRPRHRHRHRHRSPMSWALMEYKYRCTHLSVYLAWNRQKNVTNATFRLLTAIGTDDASNSREINTLLCVCVCVVHIECECAFGYHLAVKFALAKFNHFCCVADCGDYGQERQEAHAAALVHCVQCVHAQHGHTTNISSMMWARAKRQTRQVL